MTERIKQELKLLTKRYPNFEYVDEGLWILIPSFPLPKGWSCSSTDVVFQIPISYPGTPPYGIYTPSGLTYNGEKPDNYVEPAKKKPPFEGSWGFFSWSPGEGQWRPTDNVISGFNLINWVMGFNVRFQEGK